MVQADPKYNNLLVSKFINKTMKKGKKFLAQKIVYGAFDYIKGKTKKEPLDVFNQALDKVSPIMETKPKRVGGATYQVPTEVNEKRKTSLAMNWIIEAAKKKKGGQMNEKLAEELISAAKEEGSAVKKRIDIERMAEANRAFAHLNR
ncbi:MAG: 30S ribosomal protein S7 [Patescibacteria group bacterium]